MVSEVQYKVSNHTYIYQNTSYRNKKGQPRNKHTPIGKIDPTTGQKSTNPNTSPTWKTPAPQ